MTASMDIEDLIGGLAGQAKAASRVLARASSASKNEALSRIADRLERAMGDIIEANELDIARAADAGMGRTFLDRLTLTDARVLSMARGLRELVALPDPVGEVLGMTIRPNGLQVGRMRAPLGVIGIVYEARPNVTVDATGLCLKSGNAVVLRGGSEAIESNTLLAGLVGAGLLDAGLPAECVRFVETTSREAVVALARQKGVIDLIIARGSGAMIHALSEAATVPLVEHGGGVCHVYIHKAADIRMAIAIAVNAKVSRPGVCNSAETFLVDGAVAQVVLPPLLESLREQGVEVRGCERVMAIAPGVVPADEADWSTEYLDLIVSIRVVDGLDEAVSHINRYSTHHSDAICTEDYTAARRFVAEVDSAAVYVNASTRFTDGNEFGLGAEIGISTQKLHARGPMGLNELTSAKFVILGDGQTRK